jgi:hypothetical protein
MPLYSLITHFTSLFFHIIVVVIIIIITIPVIIGATGTISKSFRKYVSTIPGNHDFRELQKTAISGTAHTSESADVKVLH